MVLGRVLMSATPPSAVTVKRSAVRSAPVAGSLTLP
jgi:hypothetical protein